MLPQLLKNQPYTAGRYLLRDPGYDSAANLATMSESGAVPLVQLNKRSGFPKRRRVSGGGNVLKPGIRIGKLIIGSGIRWRGSLDS
ncbi:MAG: hypothetical protein ACFFCW_07760 [Candidatus Hodarchaeota archaeon]